MSKMDSHIVYHRKCLYYLEEINDTQKEMSLFRKRHGEAGVKEQVELTKIINLCLVRLNHLEDKYRDTLQQLIEPVINQ